MTLILQVSDICMYTLPMLGLRVSYRSVSLRTANLHLDHVRLCSVEFSI